MTTSSNSLPQQLPELVDKLRQLVDGQHAEAERGDLMLTPSHARHRLTVDVWSSMSAAAQSTLLHVVRWLTNSSDNATRWKEASPETKKADGEDFHSTMQGTTQHWQ